MKPFAFVTPTASADGYGHSGEMLALAARRAHGADVAVVGYDWVDERYCDPEFLAMKVNEWDVAERQTMVVYFLPYALVRFRAQVTLCQTMWETDRLPDAWARLLEDMSDGVIVPSEHCRQVFQERIGRTVKAVPFGTDCRYFTAVEREPAEGVAFLMSGLLHYRKGLEFALRAFREEFGPNERVQLWLKTRRNFLDAGGETETLTDKRVHIIDQDYTRAELRTIYHNADCLLAPSRGEGSGLTPRDAMATGLPVILTDWGGLAELADERYTYPIPVEGMEAAPLENSSYGRGVTGGGDIGNFARPSIPHLRAAMRDVVEHWDAAQARGKAAAQWVRQEWTWEQCAGKWLQAIEELSNAH